MGPDPKPRHTLLWVLAGVIAAAAVIIGGGLYALVHTGGVIDEWHCSDGEAPADNAGGGSDCFAEDAALPAGWEWDPFGNRPYGCTDRWWWTEIERTLRGERVTECIRDDAPVPEGWSVVAD